MKRLGLFLGIMLSVSFVLLPGPSAAEEVAGRIVIHTQKIESIEVGDVPGHSLGVIQQTGVSFITKGPESGEIASRTGTAIFDVVKGTGTVVGYAVQTFKDGSTLAYKTSGTVTSQDGGKKTVMEGSYEYTGGTGKFAGVKGKGTHKGERIGSPKTGGDSYADFSGTEWK